VYYNGTVALEFFRRAVGSPARLGILPAAFNPPTRAHIALSEAALSSVDEVLLVLPREFPHKSYEDAAFAERVRMLVAAAGNRPRYSVASSEGGLFIDIAGECRTAYGDQARLAFICGRDAAERITTWDYGEAGAFTQMLEQFELLVAARQGSFTPSEAMNHRIHQLTVAEDLDAVSATEVRRRIRQGELWEHLVPGEIVPLVRAIYGASGSATRPVR